MDVVVLGIVLAVLSLRVTITEAPPMRASATAMNRYDQAYGLLVSWVLLGCAAWAWGSRHAGRGDRGLIWGLGLFAAAAAAGCWLASDRRLAISQAVISIAPMALGLGLGRILDQPWKRNLVLALIASLAVAASFQCLDQLLYTNPAIVSQYESDPNSLLDPMGIEPGTLQAFLFEHRLMTGGAPGYFTTRNVAGCFAALALFAVLALFIERRSGSGRRPAALLYGTVAAIIGVGLVLTRSKGAILGLAAAAVIGWAMTKGRSRISDHKRMVWTLAVVIAVCGLGGVVLYGVRHGRLPGGASMAVRWEYWQAAGRMIADHPLGVGPGNFGTYYSHYKPSQALEAVADPHNLVLSLLAQVGPVGLLGFVIVIATGLRRALAPPSSTDPDGGPSPTTPRWGLAVVAAAVAAALFVIRPWVSAILAANEGGPSAYAALLDYGIGGVLALAGLLLLSEGPKAAHGQQPSGRRPYGTVVLAAGVLVVLVANLTDYALFEPGMATCFWAMVGCLIASSRGRGSEPLARPRRTAAGAWALTAGSVLVLAACWIWVVSPVLQTSILLEQARVAATAGDPDLSHELLDRASTLDRLSAAAPGMQGKSYLQQYLQAGGKDPWLLEKAVDSLAAAVNRNPEDFRDYERLGDTYDLMSRPDQACQAYSDAIGRYPGCDRLWLRLGQTAEKCGRTQLATDSYAKAVDIEDAFRRQFAGMYPGWKKPVSRLGEQNYQFAKQRLSALGQK
jgi:tetratricopeptide (TPR) repeat protein